MVLRVYTREVLVRFLECQVDDYGRTRRVCMGVLKSVSGRLRLFWVPEVVGLGFFHVHVVDHDSCTTPMYFAVVRYEC